jgi:hypothetical protein
MEERRKRVEEEEEEREELKESTVNSPDGSVVALDAL